MLTAQEPQCKPKTGLNHFVHLVYFRGTDFVITKISCKFIRLVLYDLKSRISVEKVMYPCRDRLYLNRHRLTVKLWIVLYQQILKQCLWHRDKNYIMLVYVWSE